MKDYNSLSVVQLLCNVDKRKNVNNFVLVIHVYI